MGLDLDKLLPLLDVSPFLDQVEIALRKDSKTALADNLLKLQQDVGIDAQKIFGTLDLKAGERTARLCKDHQEVTAARINGVLLDSHAALPEGKLRKALSLLIKNLAVEKIAASSAPMPTPYRAG